MLSVFIEDYEQASALRFHYFQNLSVKTVPLVKLIHSFLYFNYWLILCNNIFEAFLQFGCCIPSFILNPSPYNRLNKVPTKLL